MKIRNVQTIIDALSGDENEKKTVLLVDEEGVGHYYFHVKENEQSVKLTAEFKPNLKSSNVGLLVEKLNKITDKKKMVLLTNEKGTGYYYYDIKNSEGFVRISVV